MTEKFQKDILAFSCCDGFKLDDDKEKNEELHETIKENNEEILDCYSQQAYFKDILPNILKASRRGNFYDKIVKKGFKHKSPFFKILLKAIKDISGRKYNMIIPKKVKRLNIYRLPEIDLIRIRKDKIYKNNQKKLKKLKLEKEKLLKYTELINEQLASSSIFNKNKNKTPKSISLLSTLNLSSSNNSFNRQFNSTEKLSKNFELSPSNKGLTSYYKSDIKFKTLSKNNSYISSPIHLHKKSIDYLFDKCKEEIDHGNKVAEKVFKYDQKISKSIEKKLKKNNNKSTERLKKMIEDKGKKRNKYAKLEENNIKNIKRKMNEKISDFYAFRNRKEFQEILKNSENNQAYNIYMDELNKINEKMGRLRAIERKKIDKIEILCDDGFKKKEYLKNRIDIFNKRHKEAEKENNIIPNDDFYILNRNNEKNQIGSLLPKLLSLRQTCLNEINLGNYFNKK